MCYPQTFKQEIPTMPSANALARKNMVDCQVQTNGVVEASLLEGFAKVPRESFLPASRQSVAYHDEHIILSTHSYMLSPMVQGRLLQVADLKPDDVVLNIGDTTGYVSALLSPLVSTVMTLEGRTPASEQVRQAWVSLGCNNIVSVAGSNTSGCPDHAPYTVIMMNGAVSAIPSQVLSQLSAGGRLVCILQPQGSTVGTITVIACDEHGCYSHKSQFDATAPWVDGLAPAKEFKF